MNLRTVRLISVAVMGWSYECVKDWRTLFPEEQKRTGR